MKFHHIGIATPNIEDGIEKAKRIFDIQHISDVVYDNIQNVNLCMLKTADGLLIELIEGEKVNRFTTKKQYLYHTCFSVDDIEAEIEKLKKAGATVISKPVPAILFENKKVAFVFCFMGIVELVEK